MTAATLRVLPDPAAMGGRFDPGSEYANRIWLPTIGPASWTLWRQLARGATLHTAGWTTSIEDLAAYAGLGSPHGNQSGVARALRRLTRFGITRHAGSDVVIVRCRLPFITPGQLDRLPPIIQDIHRDLLDRSHAPRRTAVTVGAGRAPSTTPGCPESVVANGS